MCCTWASLLGADRLHQGVGPVLARHHLAPAAAAFGWGIAEAPARAARVDGGDAVDQGDRVAGGVKHELRPLHGAQHLCGAVDVRYVRRIRLDRRNVPRALDVAREEVARDRVLLVRAVRLPSVRVREGVPILLRVLPYEGLR